MNACIQHRFKRRSQWLVMVASLNSGLSMGEGCTAFFELRWLKQAAEVLACGAEGLGFRV